MWCTPVEADFSADATVTCYVPDDIFLPLLPSVIERERLRDIEREQLRVTNSGDDGDDDATTDDDTTAHVTFYGNLDNGDYCTVDCDYPTDDEASETSDTDLFSGDLSPDARFDLQHPPPDDVYYDAIEDLPSIVVHHGHKIFRLCLRSSYVPALLASPPLCFLGSSSPLTLVVLVFGSSMGHPPLFHHS